MGEKRKLGQMLKTALAEEVFAAADKPCCRMIPALFQIHSVISKELAFRIKKYFFMTAFFTLEHAIHEEEYEKTICKMIVKDPVFRKNYPDCDSEELYDYLDRRLELIDIDESWFSFLNTYVPNLVRRENHLYLATSENGLFRVDLSVLATKAPDYDGLKVFEKVEGLQRITDIEGFSDTCLFARDEGDDNRYYSYDFERGQTIICNGNLHGICGGTPIVEKGGKIFACAEDNNILLFEKSDHNSFMIKPDRVIVGCNVDNIEDVPYYYSCRDWRTYCLGPDEMTELFWEYVIRRLYSVQNKTETTFHVKQRPSQTMSGAFYGPIQMTPPQFLTLSQTSKRIREIVNHRPDNRNVQLFIEVLKHVDRFDDGRTMIEQLWEHVINDKGEKTPGGVFSEEYVENLIGHRVQSAELNNDLLDRSPNAVIHEMKLYPKSFEQIRSGSKTIEMRMYDEKLQKVRIYDDIIFTNIETGEKMGAVVVGIYIFPNFETLFAKLPLLKCGYNEDTVEKASPDDMDKYYPKSIREKNSVVGIEIRLKDVNLILSNDVQRMIDKKILESKENG